jgi:DNA-binding NarL/FixJ family response regulator
MNLTPRQTEVIALRCGEGLFRKEIAVRLGIKEETVRCHLTDITARMGVGGYQQCAEWGRMQAVTAIRSDAV